MVFDMIKRYTCLEEANIREMIKNSQMSYKMYYKTKKNGGLRQIFHPSKETKLLQYAIIDMLLSKINIHHSATAYVEGRKSPLLKNAIQHANFNYSLHVDFKDFFPSIVPNDLLNTLFSIGIDLNNDDKYILRKILFISHKGKEFLSIGAPASPVVSNIVMTFLDSKLYTEAIETYHGIYTRYADDIWFSTNSKSGSNEYYEFIEKTLLETISPKVIVNKNKTLFCSKRKARIITGLTVTPSGEVVVPRIKKRILRSLLLKKKNGLTTLKENNYIKGYLSFIRDIEPDYINHLIIKYGENLIIN